MFTAADAGRVAPAINRTQPASLLVRVRDFPIPGCSAPAKRASSVWRPELALHFFQESYRRERLGQENRSTGVPAALGLTGHQDDRRLLGQSLQEFQTGEVEADIEHQQHHVTFGKLTHGVVALGGTVGAISRCAEDFRQRLANRLVVLDDEDPAATQLGPLPWSPWLRRRDLRHRPQQPLHDTVSGGESLLGVEARRGVFEDGP